jgi:hypothetical protein
MLADAEPVAPPLPVAEPVLHGLVEPPFEQPASRRIILATPEKPSRMRDGGKEVLQRFVVVFMYDGLWSASLNAPSAQHQRIVKPVPGRGRR